MSDECRAFLTGSRRYGTPTAESDIDLAILCENNAPMSEFAVSLLWKMRDQTASSCRFGNLNLITFTIKENFLKWRRVTEELEMRKPVTREDAIAAFQAAGFKGYGENKEQSVTDEAAK